MKKYNDYKDSGVDWIGEIPSHWECIRLGMLGNFSSSGIDKKLNEDEYPVRMVNFTDLIQSRNYFPIQTGEKKYMKVTTPYSKFIEHRLNKGDMVFIPSSETHEDLGYSSLIDFDEDDVVYSYHILRFRTNREIYHYYKKYLVNHHSVLNQFSSEGKGTTRQIIGRNVFNNVRVVLPPLSEQQQIVSYMDTKTSQIDSLIEKTQRKIELLKEKRTSLINEVVTKGLNPNVEMKDSDVEWIGEIPSHWSCIGLKLVLDLLTDFESNGSFSSVKENVTVLEDIGPVWYVRMTDLENGNIRNEHCKYCDLKTYEFLHKTKLDGGELLITKRGEIGKVYLFPKNSGVSTLGPNSYLLKLNETKVFPPFLFNFYKSDYGQITLKLMDKSTTIGSLYKDDLKNSKIILPPLSEQNEIVSYLDEHTQLIDKTVSIEERRIELLKEYRQSLISEVVTGKRKVIFNE